MESSNEDSNPPPSAVNKFKAYLEELKRIQLKHLKPFTGDQAEVPSNYLSFQPPQDETGLAYGMPAMICQHGLAAKSDVFPMSGEQNNAPTITFRAPYSLSGDQAEVPSDYLCVQPPQDETDLAYGMPAVICQRGLATKSDVFPMSGERNNAPVITSRTPYSLSGDQAEVPSNYLCFQPPQDETDLAYGMPAMICQRGLATKSDVFPMSGERNNAPVIISRTPYSLSGDQAEVPSNYLCFQPPQDETDLAYGMPSMICQRGLATKSEVFPMSSERNNAPVITSQTPYSLSAEHNFMPPELKTWGRQPESLPHEEIDLTSKPLQADTHPENISLPEEKHEVIENRCLSPFSTEDDAIIEDSVAVESAAEPPESNQPSAPPDVAADTLPVEDVEAQINHNNDVLVPENNEIEGSENGEGGSGIEEHQAQSCENESELASQSKHRKVSQHSLSSILFPDSYDRSDRVKPSNPKKVTSNKATITPRTTPTYNNQFTSTAPSYPYPHSTADSHTLYYHGQNHCTTAPDTNASLHYNA